jgi:hypothetical protein
MSARPLAKRRAKTRPTRSEGSRCVWPSGVQAHFGISATTRWRWERDGLLPARDYFLNRVPVGWFRETLERAARGEATADS